jgi:hypothetical protein
MAEVSSDLILEILKGLQRDLAEVKGGIGELKTELSAVRGHLISMQQDIHNIYAVMGRHEVRLDRIDARLDLSTAPAS